MRKLTRHIFTIICSAIFVCLMSLAIWDASIIAKDYMYDNRVTVIKKRDLTPILPFLNDTRLCLVYPSPIFPAGTITMDVFRSLIVSRWRGHKIPWSRNTSDEQASVANAIFDLWLPFMLIRKIDKNGYQPLHEFLNKTGMNWTELAEYVDKFVRSPDSIRKIEEAWSVGRRMFVHAGNLSGVLIDFANMIGVCFEIPLAQELTESHESQNYYLDMVYIGPNGTNGNFMAPNGSTNGTSLQPYDITAGTPPAAKSLLIRLPGGVQLVDMEGADPAGTRKITISISNIGVFDSRRFPPCSENFETEDLCTLNEKMQTLYNFCNCIPFHRFVRKAILENRTAAKEFCTVRRYEQCWNKGMHLGSKKEKEIEASGRCKPCSFAKNSYTVTKQPSVKDGWYYVTDGWLPRIELKFECPDRTYLLFEDKRQYSSSQLFSQIGGDLGLYLGISMLSLMELAVFFYRLYEKKKRNQKGTKTMLSLRGSLRILAHYFFQNEEVVEYSRNELQMTEKQSTEEFKRDVLENIGALKARLRHLEGTVMMKMEQRLASMDRRMEMISDEMKRNMRMIMNKLG